MTKANEGAVVSNTEEKVDGVTGEKCEEVCFFGGEISFDAPVEYDDKPDKIRSIRFAFSMTHFSLFVYIMVSQGVAALLTVLSMASFAVNGGGLDSLNADFMLVLNAVSQYIIAFPLFLLLAKNAKRKPVEVKEKISVGKFMLFFVVAAGAMQACAFISTLCTRLFDRLIGLSSESMIDALLGDANPVIAFVCACILAPIFEELIFRRVLMDRLSAFGGGVAICFSAVAFGLFHGNFSQMLYATAVGLVLGYVYHRTGRVIYTVLLHAMLNFVSGLIPLAIDQLEIKANADRSLLSLYEVLSSAYVAAMVLLIIAAIAITAVALIRRRIKLEGSGEYDAKTVVKAGIANTGFILFLATSLILAIITMLSI